MQYTKQEWREKILAGWDKWGTGNPLDPKTVEHLSTEFAKPIQYPSMPYFHGKEPFVYLDTHDWPWRSYGSTYYDPSLMIRPQQFMSPYMGGVTAWWDGSCLCTDLVLEGPKSIVKWESK